MGSIVLYILEWAFALIVLLTIYKAAFSGTTFYRFNRFYLLGATVLSALLPLLHITLPEKTPVVSDLAIEQMDFAQELTGTFVFTAEPLPAVTVPAEPATKSGMWAVVMVCMYSAYVLMLLVGWSRSIIRARRFLRGKHRRRVSRTVWLVTHDEDFGPFSWMNYIVISDTESGFARKASLRHEFAHIRLLHSADLVFLLACTVVNPVCWLVLQEIKIVHEFEADNEVINRYGIRNSDYQKLLIMRTVGAEAYALASSFNLNIKKRIIMLNKNQTRRRRLMWLLLLIPMLGMTSVLFARTEKAVNTDGIETDTYDYNDFRIIIQGDIISGQKLKWHHENGLDECIVATDPRRLQLDGIEDFIDGPDLVKENIQQVTILFWPNSPTETLDELKTILKRKGMLNIKYETPSVFDQVVLKPEMIPDSDEDHIAEIEDGPEFPGGTQALLEYMRTHIRYPADAREQDIQGRVLVTFIVNKDGSIAEPEVVKSVYPSLDEEALKMISTMPKWKPGMNRGKPVRTKYTLPVNFRLGSIPQPDKWIGVERLNLLSSEQYSVYRFKEYEELAEPVENLESAVKDLFEGKTKAFAIPNTDENLKKLKEIIAKYPDKKVNWM